jgi:hypothetical protein
MKYEITKMDGKDVLAIVIDVSPDALTGATASASGKSKVVASTHGNKAIGLPGGKVLHLGVNAYIRA